MIRIFYVEDEPFLAKIVSETLEGKGYDITLIGDGQEAIEQFDEKQYDICLLDIMLPSKNGFEIAEAIRKCSDKIPILFLTAKDQTEDLVKGFEVGGNDYIRKPFSMEELMVRIDNLLRLTERKTKASKENITIGASFFFSPYKLDLFDGDKHIQLSHRESQILEMLCSNGDKPTERKDILMKVWGDDSFYNSRNLDVYITKLRAYFKPDKEIKIITLKGVGYQFVVK